MKAATIAATLTFLSILQGCGAVTRSNPVTPPKAPPPEAPGTLVPGSTTSGPENGQSPATDPASPVPGTPVSICSVEIEGGKPFGEWTLVPYGKFRITVNATGAQEVTLSLHRYPSSPAVPEQKPDDQEGDRYLFQVDISNSAFYQVATITARYGDKIVTEHRNLFAVKPEFAKFATLAKGRVSGWPEEKDAQVRELFQEGAIYWFQDQGQYLAFAKRLNSLVGLSLPEDLQGKTAIVLFGSPAGGPRSFEAVQVELPPGEPATVPPEYLRIVMDYQAPSVSDGPVSAPYHILLMDTRVYQRPGTLTVWLMDAPFARPFAENQITLAP
jgi:hypothetical protein